jgi:hypothetical protein
MAATTLEELPAPGWWRRALRAVAVPGLIVSLGLFGGVLSGIGNVQLVGIFMGLAVAALAASSRRTIFWLVVISAMVVTGAAQLYFPSARLVRYLAPAVSLALLLHWVMDQFTQRRRTADESLPAPVVWALAFGAIAIVSTLANFGDPAVAAMGMKSYFQMWVFFLSLVFVYWDKSFGRQLWKGLLLVALLQLPFAAHQYLVLMPRRFYYIDQGVIPADVVAGTFGAQALGGGANAVLAAFQIIVVGFLLAMWKNGRASMPRLVLLSALLLSPLLVNQARVSVLYLLLVFVVIFWRDILRRPGKFILASAGVAGLVAVLMTAMMLRHPGGELSSWSALVEKAYEQQTTTIQERDGQVQLSRWDSLTYWAQQHLKANPLRTLLGHGPGATREPDETTVGEVSNTLAQKKYPGMRIGYTGLSALLWETGVLGVVCVLGMFLSAFLTAGRLVTHYRRRRDDFHAALFEGLQAAIAVLALSLAHKNFFVVHLPYQAIVYLLIGFIANASLVLIRQQVPGYAARGV